MLQVDRNPGNFLVGKGDDGAYTLTPVDQGLAFPSKEGLSRRAMHGLLVNQIRAMPGADEPFDDEMLARIEMIEPDELESALKQQRDVMKKQYPGMKVV